VLCLFDLALEWALGSPFIAARRRPRCTGVAMLLLWLEETCPSPIVAWPAGWPPSLASSLVKGRTSESSGLSYNSAVNGMVADVHVVLVVMTKDVGNVGGACRE